MSHRWLGGFITATDNPLSNTFAPALITSNLFLYLDAGLTTSYSGSGTVWNDISGNGRNFNIVATAYNSSGPKYMDFNGSYGMAKNTGDLSLSDSTGITFIVATRVKSSTGDWRTLTRGYGGDHQIIVQSGGNAVGMYDNDGGAFIDASLAQTSLPNYGTTNWMLLYIRWQATSPYMEISWNNTPGTIRGSSTSTSARYTRGFGSIGGYMGDGLSTDPSVGSQFWGDIGLFLVYNKRLSDAELTQNYNYFKSRFGL